MQQSSRRYMFIVAAMAMALTAILWRVASVNLIGFATATLLLAAPVWTVLALISAARKAHDAAIFRERVWWRLLAGGHITRLGLAALVALATGGGLVLGIMVDPGQTAVLAATGALLTPAIAGWLARRADRPIIPAQQLGFVLRMTVLVTGGILLGLSLALRGAPVSLADLPRYVGSSALLGQLTDFFAIWTALGEMLRTGDGGWIRALVMGVALDAAQCFGLATVLAGPLATGRDMRRILRPSQEEEPPQPTRASVAILSFCGFVTFLILLGGLADIEGRLARVLADSRSPMMQMPEIGSVPPVVAGGSTSDGPPRLPPVPFPSTARALLEREQVGDQLCPPGTIDLLVALDEEHRLWWTRQSAEMASLLAGGFDTMRARVPQFLDWYYSLGAEYLRTANLLIGSGDAYLQARILERLEVDVAFAGFQIMTEIVAAGPSIMDQQLAADRELLLRDCGLALPDDEATIAVTAVASDELLTLPELSDRIPLETRLGSAGLVGAGTAAVIAAKFGGKVMLSGAFKAAAFAIAKVAGSKALTLLGGVGAGAVGGGAAGSVVPGAGTTAGAIIGGIAGGVAVTLGVDFGILKLEEAVSRAAFEADLMAAIDATEAEMMAQLGLIPSE